MTSMGAGYDLSVSTFSPDGKVFQVEYAAKAVDKSGLAIGFCCKDGVVLATEKVILNKMVVAGSSRRVFAVDTHITMVVAGLVADGRQIVERAREEAENYRDTYGDAIPGNVLAQRLAMFVHAYTLYWSVRPFGVSVLIGVNDAAESSDPESKSSPEIYCIEPAGTCYKYSGYAVGKGRQLAKTELEKFKSKDITCRQAVEHLARIIAQVGSENRDKDIEIEMSWICPESGNKTQLVPTAIIKEAEVKAQAYLDALDQD